MCINRYVTVVIFIAMFTSAALAIVSFNTGYPLTIPVDRVIKNTTAYIQENPEDAHGYYTLARVYYFAFINKSFRITGHESNSLVNLYNDLNVKDRLYHEHANKIVLREMGLKPDTAISHEQHQKITKAINQKIKELKKQNWHPPTPSHQQLLEHARLALKNFKIAIKMEDEIALYHLGLATFLEQYVDFLKTGDSATIPKELHSIILEKSKETYYKAHKLSIKSDLKRNHFPLLAHESADGYIRLIKNLGSLPKGEEDRIKEIKKNIKKLESHELKIKKRLETDATFYP